MTRLAHGLSLQAHIDGGAFEGRDRLYSQGVRAPHAHAIPAEGDRGVDGREIPRRGLGFVGRVPARKLIVGGARSFEAGRLATSADGVAQRGGVGEHGLARGGRRGGRRGRGRDGGGLRSRLAARCEGSTERDDHDSSSKHGLDDIMAIERSMAPVGPQDCRRTVDVDRMASPRRIATTRDGPGACWAGCGRAAGRRPRVAPRRAAPSIRSRSALAALIEPAADVAHAPPAFDAADARLIRALEPLVARADIATSGFRPAVGRVGELLAFDDQDVNGAVRAVLREPVVVAAVLTMANSPECAGVAVAEVRTAVERLGVELVRQLALGMAARALHEPDPMAASPGRRERGDQIVHRALTTAFAVAWYGQNRGLHAADVAYVAALFLDVGRTAAYDALARLEHAGGNPPIGDWVAEEVVDSGCTRGWAPRR